MKHFFQSKASFVNWIMIWNEDGDDHFENLIITLDWLFISSTSMMKNVTKT